MDTNNINPINILIVDDENKACTNLQHMLLNYVDPDLKIIGFAHDVHQALEQISRYAPDAVFLDIHMPRGNVFELLDQLSPLHFEVIFVTAYDEYAIKAFRLNALDYILKPISLVELKNAVANLKNKVNYKRIIAGDIPTFSEINHQVNNQQAQTSITFKGANFIEVVNFKDIVFIEAQSSYCRVQFIKENEYKELTMSNPLLEYEELLPDNIFFRIHKSYLVNCNFIKGFENNDTNNIMLHNNIVLPVSRRRYVTLIDFLKANKFNYVPIAIG